MTQLSTLNEAAIYGNKNQPMISKKDPQDAAAATKTPTTQSTELADSLSKGNVSLANQIIEEAAKKGDGLELSTYPNGSVKSAIITDAKPRLTNIDGSKTFGVTTKTFSENGKPQSLKKELGPILEEEKQYYSNGKLKKSAILPLGGKCYGSPDDVHDACDVTTETFYENGNPKSLKKVFAFPPKDYKDYGTFTGEEKQYYSNGNLKSSIIADPKACSGEDNSKPCVVTTETFYENGKPESLNKTFNGVTHTDIKYDKNGNVTKYLNKK